MVEHNTETSNLLKGYTLTPNPLSSGPPKKQKAGDEQKSLGHLRFRSVRNSSRVFALDRMYPSIQLVVVVLPVF
jgi:hypothetical protein